MNSGNKDFGKRIKELRIAQNLTQEELAEKIGLEYQTISRIETGYYFTNFTNLLKFADVFKISVKDLFDFNHFLSEDELKKCICDEVANMNLTQLQFTYKSIQNMKEYNP